MLSFTNTGQCLTFERHFGLPVHDDKVLQIQNLGFVPLGWLQLQFYDPRSPEQGCHQRLPHAGIARFQLCTVFVCVFVCNSKYSRHVRVLKFWFWFCTVVLFLRNPRQVGFHGKPLHFCCHHIKHRSDFLCCQQTQVTIMHLLSESIQWT